MARREIVYFDNNATTLMCMPAIKAHDSWISSYNISTDSKVAKPGRDMVAQVSADILKHHRVSSLTHTIIFTSGGSESNCFAIKACVSSFLMGIKNANSTFLPHLITSKLEHDSILKCVDTLVKAGSLEVSYVQCNIDGSVLASDIEKLIRPTTCLITIQTANNEIPVLNNVAEIAAMARKHNIPYHTDAVQSYGKLITTLNDNKISALSASAHKFYGPKGVGILIIDNNLVEGYRVVAEISGTQQQGLRGGTINVAGIASCGAALKYTFMNRGSKNNALTAMRNKLVDGMVGPGAQFKRGYYKDYLAIESDGKGESKRRQPGPLEIVFLGPEKGLVVPGVVLMSVAKNIGKPFCNVDLKKDLERNNFIVSIGSACLTDNPKASHVLDAIGAPAVIKKGVIRVSFGDTNKLEEVNSFIKVLTQCIVSQCTDIAEELGWGRIKGGRGGGRGR